MFPNFYIDFIEWYDGRSVQLLRSLQFTSHVCTILFYFLLAWTLTLVFAVVYLQLYALEHAIDKTLAFYSVCSCRTLIFLVLIVNLHQLAIMNGSGVIGRMSANYLAESYGVWNMQVPVTFISGITVMATLGM